MKKSNTKDVGAGRPTIYTHELVEAICEQISDGKSMRTICRMDGMPVMTTIFRWLRENPEFKQRYDVAKSFQADALAEDMLEIADSEASITSDGKVDSGHVQHRRLQIDTRKWVASKLLPKKYGDKLEQEVKGDVGLVVQIVRIGDDGEIND